MTCKIIFVWCLYFVFSSLNQNLSLSKRAIHLSILFFHLCTFLLLKLSEKRKWLLRQKKYFIVYSAYYNQRNSSTWMWSRVYSSLCSVILSSLFSDVSFSVCWYIIFTFCLMLFQPWYSFVYFVANSPFIWFCKFPCFIITINWRLRRWLGR